MKEDAGLQDLDETMVGIIDISEKEDITRVAEAAGTLYLTKESYSAILNNQIIKGDIIEACKITAILAVKNTPSLLPHCHPIPIHGVSVNVSLSNSPFSLECHVTVKTRGKTGAEMDALVGVSSALLCAWDMIKPHEKDSQGQYPFTKISNIRVIYKEKSE